MTQPNIITHKEMARRIGITDQTLYRWEKKGVLTPKRHPANNVAYYTEKDYEEYLKRIEEGTSKQKQK